ncbi:DUF3572 domain-containing protein [Sphingomonas sanxanigenens]|uniref:DUF3572 domain-containing protein n=1 Tax=Sphingomonas sanxanigenens DSM 19645 = NX02 TaxID=1123269 RepID=W0AGS7_9SPHN|nr:DUF3572 domain-containing protein [Sphingomonas sanxanigenens]AHE56331.1 hypothetical protein NX02_23585 [Sphingomonas sanxanigenens DSM 19645 = NX02]
MADKDMNPLSDATVLALHALAWTLVEPARADRLIALTGIDPLDLRARAAEPPVQAAVLVFLESHEPDLIACAAALDVKPEVLVEARQRLEA